MNIQHKPRPGITIPRDQECSGIPVPLLLRFRQSPVIHGSCIHVPPVVLRNLRSGIQAWESEQENIVALTAQPTGCTSLGLGFGLSFSPQILYVAMRGLVQDHLSGLGLLDKLLPLLERLRVIFPVLFLLVLFLVEKVLLPTKSCNPALTVVTCVCMLLNTLGCEYTSCSTIPFLVQKGSLHEIHENKRLYRKC